MVATTALVAELMTETVFAELSLLATYTRQPKEQSVGVEVTVNENVVVQMQVIVSVPVWVALADGVGVRDTVGVAVEVVVPNIVGDSLEVPDGVVEPVMVPKGSVVVAVFEIEKVAVADCVVLAVTVSVRVAVPV